MAIVLPHFVLHGWLDYGLILDEVLKGIFLILIIGAWMIFGRDYLGRCKLNSLDFLILFFLAGTVLDAFFRGMNSTSYVILASGLYYFALGAILAQTSERRWFCWFAACVLVSTVVQTMYIILQFVGVVENYNVLHEIGGTFGHPGYTFGILSLGLLLVISQRGFLNFNRWVKYAFYILLLLLLIFEVYTLSRASILVTVTALGIGLSREYSLADYLDKKNTFLLFSLCLGLILYLAYVKSDSLRGRFLIWKNTVALIMERPISGHGADSFRDVYNNYQVTYFQEGRGSEKENELADYVALAYNDFLEVGLELGIIGMITLSCIFIVLLRRTVFRPDLRDFVFPVLGFLVFMNTWGIFHEPVYATMLFTLLAFYQNRSLV